MTEGTFETTKAIHLFQDALYCLLVDGLLYSSRNSVLDLWMPSLVSNANLIKSSNEASLFSKMKRKQLWLGLSETEMDWEMGSV